MSGYPISTLSECPANPTVHRVDIQLVLGEPMSTLSEYSVQYQANLTVHELNIHSVSGQCLLIDIKLILSSRPI